MTEPIWSVEYIRQNPELAAKAINSLQTILGDLEMELRELRDRLDEIQSSS
jgi:archaellum component FlaD/FlaE